MSTSKAVFSASSPGFIYTIVVLALTFLASLGVNLSDSPDAIAGGLISSFSSGGIWALSGILLTSVLFPIYNLWRQKIPITWKNVFRSTANWIALGNVAFSAALLFGIAIPVGTVEAIVKAIGMQDWGALFNLFLVNIATPLIRWIKERNK